MGVTGDLTGFFDISVNVLMLYIVQLKTVWAHKCETNIKMCLAACHSVCSAGQLIHTTTERTEVKKANYIDSVH